MVSGGDYAQQTELFNVIDDTLITELTRVVCYSQTIYDDAVSEGVEYFGLSLAIIDGPQTTSYTQIRPSYDQAAIVIVDDECKKLFVYTYTRKKLVILFTALCPELSNPADGIMTVSDSMVIFSCDSGFGLVGSPVLTCQSNGVWSSAPPVCKRKLSKHTIINMNYKKLWNRHL